MAFEKFTLGLLVGILGRGLLALGLGFLEEGGVQLFVDLVFGAI